MTEPATQTLIGLVGCASQKLHRPAPAREGLGIGQQLGWLTCNLQEAQSA